MRENRILSVVLVATFFLQIVPIVPAHANVADDLRKRLQGVSLTKSQEIARDNRNKRIVETKENLKQLAENNHPRTSAVTRSGGKAVPQPSTPESTPSVSTQTPGSSQEPANSPAQSLQPPAASLNPPAPPPTGASEPPTPIGGITPPLPSGNENIILGSSPFNITYPYSPVLSL